ncbi:mechanosensitive ion channel [candidate division KSB1 bacterium]|nr:mechanosensitive ion channel [candidate division KSB1 bacterium]
MQAVIEFINKYFTILNIPGTQLLLGIFIIILSLLLRKVFSIWVLNYFKKLTAKTKTELDDALLEILNPPLSYLILLIGFELARIIIGFPAEFDAVLAKWIQLGFVAMVCWLIYRSADVFTSFLEAAAKRTKTELDDVLAPYLKKVIKVAAVVIVIMKAAEILLGMSAAALLGLLGGMGLTLGLVFKDIVANWFGCAIIYIDNLFREGDWVMLDDGKIVDADVEEIGLRSTKFRNFDKTVSVVPNATIASAVVKNWSKMYKRRVKYNFNIDGISVQKLKKILTGLREILANDEGVHQEFHMVNFREMVGNTRVIRLYYFTKTTAWKEHEQIRENVNIQILKLFEKEAVDKLAYTIVDLSDDRPGEYEKMVKNQK